MYLPRLFSLPLTSLSVITLIAVTGLMSACQPQNLATNGTPASTQTVTTAKTDASQTPLAVSEDSIPDLVVTETTSEAITSTVPDANQDDTDSAPLTNDNSPTIVASAPLQSADMQPTEAQSAETQTPEAQTPESQSQDVAPQETVPEIVIPKPTPTPAPPPPAEFKPHTVLSKPDTVLLSVLGAADIIRAEGVVKIWQYRLDRCVFDFFLTPDNSLNSDSRYAVRDWAYRASTLGATVNELICRRALAKDRMMSHNG